MSDGRFTRTDNNSSPVSNVPSTMSQQTGSGGPMLNALPYAYFYGANMMPGSFQYGTPAALYPQQLATNASSNAQFAKPSYNSAYGSSGYDALGQSTQDYNKTAYPGSGTQQSKGQNVSNQPPSGTGSDISSSMYGNKNHAALSKVNVSGVFFLATNQKNQNINSFITRQFRSMINFNQRHVNIIAVI